MAEGYSTAMTIHELTGEFCAVSFGKAGLFDVARHFSETNKIKPVIIACDFDMSIRGQREPKTKVEKEKLIKTGGDWVETPSPIEEIQKKITYHGLTNIFTIFPKFPVMKTDLKLSDYNDLYSMDKIECKAQLDYTHLLKNFAVPLTFMGNDPVLWSYKTGIIHIDPKASKEKLLRLANKDFWKKFGNKNGEPDWKKASEAIIVACSEGNIKYSNIKGAGVYKEKEDLIVNTGKNIIGYPNDKKNIYLPLSKKSPAFPDPRDYSLIPEEIGEVLEAVKKLNWREKNDALLLMAWIALAPFYKTLDFVTHLTINGNSGSGKSYIMDNILKPILSPFGADVVFQGTTPAGFLNKIREENLTICLLEEKENTNSLENETWLNIFRISSTTKDDPIIEKAKPGGGGIIKYPIKIVTAVFGISSFISKVQDEKRFLSINLINKGKTDFPKTYKHIKKLNLPLIGLKLYGNMYENYDKFYKEYQHIYFNLIETQETTGHDANKIAHLVASARVNLFISSQEQTELIEYLISNSDENDNLVYFDYIMERLLNTDVYNPMSQMHTVRDVLTKKEFGHGRKLLNQQGVMVKDGYIHIDKKSSFMPDKVFKGFSDDNNYKQNWVHFLKNSILVEMFNNRIYFAGRKRKCFSIKLESLPLDLKDVEQIKAVSRVNPIMT